MIGTVRVTCSVGEFSSAVGGDEAEASYLVFGRRETAISWSLMPSYAPPSAEGEYETWASSNLLGIAAESLPAAHQCILLDPPIRVSTHLASAGTGAVVLVVRVPYIRVSYL
ncbi:hypothetical protein EV1_033515 [Malus domestica]